MSAVHVLVVEHDPGVRGLLQTLPTADRYDAATASDGLGGLGEIAASRPALVLLDLMMPDLEGVRVLEELRADPALTGVAITVVIGKEEHVPHVRALIGDDNVFLRPFAVEELLNRVGAVSGGPVR